MITVAHIDQFEAAIFLGFADAEEVPYKATGEQHGRWVALSQAFARRRLTAERDALERAAVIADEVSAGFLSPDYAAGQPLSSLTERMACSMCAAAIRAAKEQGNG